MGNNLVIFFCLLLVASCQIKSEVDQNLSLYQYFSSDYEYVAVYRDSIVDNFLNADLFIYVVPDSLQPLLIERDSLLNLAIDGDQELWEEYNDQPRLDYDIENFDLIFTEEFSSKLDSASWNMKNLEWLNTQPRSIEVFKFKKIINF